MPDVGRFTYGQARRSQKGGPTMGKGQWYATDTYTVLIPSGKHPKEYSVSNIPELGATWDLASGWSCDQIQWSNTFPSEVWTAYVRYHSDSVTQGTEPDPEEQPSGGGKLVHREYHANGWKIDLESDAIDGRAVMNTAGDRFQDALTSQVYTTTVVLKYAEKNNPVKKIEQFQGTTNDDEIDVAGVTVKRHCGLITIDATENDDETYPFAVNYTVQVARNPMPSGYLVTPEGTAEEIDTTEDAGFDAVVSNVGYRYILDDDGKKYRFVDEMIDGTSALAVDPHLLNETGASASPDTRYWMRWNRYPEEDWSLMNLVQD